MLIVILVGTCKVLRYPGNRDKIASYICILTLTKLTIANLVHPGALTLRGLQRTPNPVGSQLYKFLNVFPSFRLDQTSIAKMDDEDLDEIPFGVDGADLVPDSETEDRDRLELRTEVLGFRPQKEVIHNFLLPYADKVRLILS